MDVAKGVEDFVSKSFSCKCIGCICINATIFQLPQYKMTDAITKL